MALLSVLVAVTGTVTVAKAADAAPKRGAEARALAAPTPAPEPTPPQTTRSTTIAPKSFDGDVRNLPAVPQQVTTRPLLKAPTGSKPGGSDPGAAATPSAPGGGPAATSIPAPNVTFPGVALGTTCSYPSTANTICGGGYPPDTTGDVSGTHFVQAVNTAVGIFTKTGTKLAAFTFNQLWSAAGSGTACDNANFGDPTVVWDPLTDRWIVADFAFVSETSVPFYECIAVSKTADPVAGGWWLYAVRADDATHPYLNDYPKMGINQDGLFMSANEFNSSLNFAGVRLWAFNRSDLESGAAVRTIVKDIGTNEFTLLPATTRGAQAPPGTPTYFVGESQTAWAFNVYKMSVNWTSVTATLTGPTAVAQTSYTVPPDPVVPQPGTTTTLDSLGERLMNQNQYRHIGSTESLWVSHTVRTSSSSPTAIQWAQINVTGGTVNTTAVQQQIFNNGGDTLWRWMPSLSVDEAGNMGVGYSTSSSTVFPSLSYAGRLSTDALNTLGQGETTLYAGTASQILSCGGPCTRWGDYSAMTVDPVTPCTFWYTNEYYDSAVGTSQWQTRIGSFTMPQCVHIPDIATQNVNEGDLVTIDWTGALSVPSGHTLNATLTQLAGPTPFFVQSSSATTRKFVAPLTTSAAGDTLVFDLTLTDATTGVQSTKTVTVRVANTAPVAVAGANRVVTTGGAVVLKCGSNDAVEPDTAPSGTTGRQYVWTQTGGPGVALTPGTGVDFRTASFTPAAAGTYTFQLVVTDHGGTGTASSPSSISIEARTPAPAGTLSGVVKDTGGTPQPGVTVDVLTTPSGSPAASTSTDVNGAWSIGSLANGSSYYVRFTKSGFGTRWALDGIGATGVRPVIAPSALVDATLTANGSLRTVSGTARDSSANPVNGATVLLFDDVGQLAATTTNGSGGYSFSGLTPKGNYRVSIGRANATFREAWATTDGAGSIIGSSGIPALFFNATGGNVAVPDTKLFTKTTENRTVTATVVSAGPTPVTGAEVRVYNANGYVTSTKVNASGVYTISGLRPENDYKVWVWTKCTGCTSTALTSQWYDAAPGEQYNLSGKLATVIDLTSVSVPISFTLT